MKPSCNVAALIEHYFTDRLMRQRNVSANTIASYRDTFRLLFLFAQGRLRRSPSALVLDDLDASFVNAFLEDLEKKRGASIRTRNLRLTAIRSFFRFVSFEEPASSALIQRVLAIPSKRHTKRQVHFLSRTEVEAILAVPDRTTWLGRRDHTLLLLAAQTGLRLSELIGLDRDAIYLGAGAHVRCVGKGRKERCTPLTTHASVVLQEWLKEPARRAAKALFPNVHGGCLSADSVQALLAKHVRIASERCPSLASKRVTPRTFYGTPPRWNCCKQVSNPPSSLCGSAMSRQRPRRPICTPILHSKRRPWRSSSRTTEASECVSKRMTACSPSSRRFETGLCRMDLE
jgi:integrase/recombinase XerD